MRIHFETIPDHTSQGTATDLHQCHSALDLWFCVAGVHITCFVLAFIVGWRCENCTGWWFVDPTSRIAKMAFTSTWAVLLPFHSAWTVLGMCWLAEMLHNTPDCLSENSLVTPTFCALSQVLCGIGAFAYVVFVVLLWDVQKCRHANTLAIRAVEDDDLVHRWGRQKPAASMELCGGLTPEELRDLPRHAVSCNDSGQRCVICLSDMMEDDHARSLPGCGHVFHRACIDLWLLRSTNCPLCNIDARPCKKRMQCPAPQSDQSSD